MSSNDEKTINTYVFRSQTIADGVEDHLTSQFPEIVNKKVLSLTVYVNNPNWTLKLSNSFRPALRMVGGSVETLPIDDSFVLDPRRGYYRFHQALEWSLTNDTGGNSTYEIYVDVEEDV